MSCIINSPEFFTKFVHGTPPPPETAVVRRKLAGCQVVADNFDHPLAFTRFSSIASKGVRPIPDSQHDCAVRAPRFTADYLSCYIEVIRF